MYHLCKCDARHCTAKWNSDEYIVIHIDRRYAYKGEEYKKLSFYPDEEDDEDPSQFELVSSVPSSSTTNRRQSPSSSSQGERLPPPSQGKAKRKAPMIYVEDEEDEDDGGHGKLEQGADTLAADLGRLADSLTGRLGLNQLLTRSQP